MKGVVNYILTQYKPTHSLLNNLKKVARLTVAHINFEKSVQKI